MMRLNPLLCLLCATLLSVACEPEEAPSERDVTAETCTATSGPSMVCDPNDRSRIYRSDYCGNIIAEGSVCDEGWECQQESLDRLAACRRVEDDCPVKTSTSMCDPERPTQVFTSDGCGQITGVLRDCDVGWVCQQETPQNLAACRQAETVGCDPDEPGKIFAKVEGELVAEAETCGEGESCVETGVDQAECQCSPGPTDVFVCYPDAQKIDEEAGMAPVDSCNVYMEDHEVICPLGERCWYLYEEEDVDGNGFLDALTGICATSIDPRHRGEPSYNMGCDFELYMHAQTTLKFDCRCNRSTPETPECFMDTDAWNRGLRVGGGHHWRHINNPEWGGGFVDPSREEMFTAGHYTGGAVGDSKPGTIWAVNYKTGDRRLVSGVYVDPSTGPIEAGSGYTFKGNALPFAMDVEMGDDGMLYVAGSNTRDQVEITRVHPDTGHRELVWRRQSPGEGSDATFPYGQCWSGRENLSYTGGFDPVQHEWRAFALGEDGSFYLGFRNDGVGVVRISPDGSTCEVVSRWAPRHLTTVGGGVSPQYGTLSGMLHHQGTIYAETKDVIIAIDDQTGDREVFSGLSDIGGYGETNMWVDEGRQLLFTCGIISGRKCAVIDLNDGSRAQSLFKIGQGQPVLPGKYAEPQGAKGSLDNNNNTAFGNVVLDPDDPNIMYFTINYGVVKFEIDTGNSYLISL